MKLAILIFAGACASAPKSGGSADDALAQTGPQAPVDDCEPAPTHHHGDHAPVPAAVEIPVGVATSAATEDDRKAIQDCHDRKAHDANAAGYQQSRTNAQTESTPALVQRIRAAAHANDCATVRSLEGTLDDRDAAQHDEVYGKDPDVLHCR
jgi:hypothetical protein